MKYLVVAAHPDDEILGAGASIRKWIKNGHQVAVAFLANHAEARNARLDNLDNEREKVANLLGIEKSFSADFPNIKMNTVPQLELVKFVESCIVEFEPDIIVTHHPADVNIDHSTTSGAVQAAWRLFQRREGMKPIQELMYMEVVSSTDWVLGHDHGQFVANYFVEVGKDGIEEKLNIMKHYDNVIREFPHPRSKEAIMGLAAYRGGQSGCVYAEAFECVFRRG